MPSPRLPLIGISMGDPAGIGPEIIAKALARADVHSLCRPLVIGDARVLSRAARDFAKVPLDIHPITNVTQARFTPSTLNVYHLQLADPNTFPLGKVSPIAGHAAFESVRVMIDLAMNHQIDATVTAPIHKEALHAAGHPFPGHTEIFAHYTHTTDYTMMLAADNLRVVHVSTHVSLRQACDAVTKQRVLTVIQLAHQTCQQLGIKNPTIGVAGLNPHASDNGLFGTEENDHILPAIQAARQQGIDADGPHPPDTFFPRVFAGAYDIAVAMYHDQGHIPAKIKGFHYDRNKGWTDVRGINVSLGLPIIRTSVDHGTAFDQAGQGTASDASLIDAINYAARLASSRQT